MEITIDSIGVQKPVRGGKDVGREVYFDSMAVRGLAVLVSIGNEVKVGQNLLVETDYESCDNFESVLPQATASVKYVESTNKFVVCAPISFVWEDGVFAVNIEDLKLMIEPVEGLQIREGEWLMFHIFGLSLWNISV